MQRYACFFHPECIGDSLGEKCPKCRFPFEFPLTSPPISINNHEVIKPLNRGFYGAVYKVKHPKIPERYSAAKIVPASTYEHYGKNIREEVRLHNELSEINIVAKLLDLGEQEICFHGSTMTFHWLLMEYVRGKTLADVIAEGPESPAQIAQIAYDLFDFVSQIKLRNKYHNDLHDKNIKITQLREQEVRRDAIDPRIRVKILDLGSAAEKSKSTEGRLGDIHQVSSHLEAMLSSYEKNSKAERPEDQRLCAHIRRVSEYYFASDSYRLPDPQDVMKSLRDSYSSGERPWDQKIYLDSLAQFYNAQTLPSWFAPFLFYDPGDKWSNMLMRPGPQVLYGMRGCGKTILLHSLEWLARVQNRPQCQDKTKASRESDTERDARIKNDNFLGLFVSCATLIRAPRTPEVSLPLHKLYLAYAREVIRNLRACELMKLGQVQFSAVPEFIEQIRATIDWYVPPPLGPVNLVAVERSIHTAIMEAHQKPLRAEEFLESNTRVVFDFLVDATRKLLDLWEGKILLFLLDDLSTRYLRPEHIQILLSRLCLQSDKFGIKISTETQSLPILTPGGLAALVGRDYELFDFGKDVYDQVLRGGNFIDTILEKRLSISRLQGTASPSDILGDQSLSEISRNIALEERATPIYHGISSLKSMTVGDIGEVLQLFEQIYASMKEGAWPVSAEIQHRVVVDFSANKLLSLAGQNEWLYSHAVAFAEASHQQLLQNYSGEDGGPSQETNEVQIHVSPEDADELFPLVRKLVDAGVFVLCGGEPRDLQLQETRSLPFRLAYRKVLGLSNRIPLRNYGSFQRSGELLKTWLKKPTALSLVRNEGSDVDSPVASSCSPSWEYRPQHSLRANGSGPADIGSPERQESGKKVSPRSPSPSLAFRVRASELIDISNAGIPWANAHFIGALGFEERSVGSYEACVRSGMLCNVSLIQYPDKGYSWKIVKLLDGADINYRILEAKDLTNEAQVMEYVGSLREKLLVLDISSMTKAMIFLFVKCSLRLNERLWVVHTRAGEYLPSDGALEPIVGAFMHRRFPDAFRMLESEARGETGPFECITIGRENRDPGNPSVMVAPVHLKYEKVKHLLSATPVEAIAAICIEHSDGPNSFRSLISGYVGQYLKESYRGELYSIGALDFEAMFELLSTLHRRYCLEDRYNLEIALTGTKIQAAASGAFAATAIPSTVYYCKPHAFRPDCFTRGSGDTRAMLLCLVKSGGE